MSESESVYPVAAVLECGRCGTPAVLRYTMSLSGNPPAYAYYRDCKCKSTKADPLPPQVVRVDDAGHVVRIPVLSSAL